MRDNELRGGIKERVPLKEICVGGKKGATAIVVVTGVERTGNTYFPLFAHIHFTLL